MRNNNSEGVANGGEPSWICWAILLTEDEARDALRLSPRELELAIVKLGLPVVRVGRLRRFEPLKLRHWAREASRTEVDAYDTSFDDLLDGPADTAPAIDEDEQEEPQG